MIKLLYGITALCQVTKIENNNNILKGKKRKKPHVYLPSFFLDLINFSKNAQNDTSSLI